MRVPFAIFVSLALALPTLAAPIVRDVEARDLVATRASPEITRDYDSTFAPAIDADADADEDESALEVRKVAAKAKAPAKAKPIAKPPVKAAPKAKPAPKPVQAKPAPVKAAPKPAPVKAVPKPVAKPVKPVAKPPAKAPVKPVTKPPVKPVAKPPAKAPVKPVAKPPVKAPAKPVAKPPVKAPVKPVAKPPVKAPSKAVSSAAKPSASSKAVSSCALPKSKPASAKLRGRTVSGTQFHATCKNFAASIKSAIAAGTFALQPERIFPNEFTWSGGFYVTPDKGKALLFGATFLGEKCASHGGVVLMQLKLSTSGLKLNEVSSIGRTAVTFGANQSRLGNAVKLFLKKQAPSDALPADPPSDQGISADDNPAVQKPPIAIPTEDEVQGFLDANPKNFNKQNKDAFAAIKGVDVVAAAAPLSQGQKSTINHAKTVGMAPLEEPFNQVVLISDKAMKAVEFVSQEDLPDCLATQATELVALLKKINAEA